MTTEVIILAQGRQERMGSAITGPKHLLPLPACNGAPILARTLGQLWLGANGWGLEDLITIVTWPEVIAALSKSPPPPFVKATLGFTSLLDPGNSSLKGIHRYLESQALIAGAPRPDRTVVLLGDVVYSWRCLEAIFADFPMPPLGNPAGSRYVRFVGTADISPSGGELWGVAWMRADHDAMMDALERALDKHPPFDDTYQPGQLRRWMWALHPAYQTTPRYSTVDDYSKDIDTPADLELIEALSRAAAEDDAAHGVRW